MSMLWGSGMFFLFLVAVTALIVGSVAVAKANNVESGTDVLENAQLKHPRMVGSAPTISAVTVSSFFANPSIAAGSSDSSGLIQATSDSSVSASVEFVITFNTPYNVVPTSVNLTPANNQMALQAFWVNSISTTGFTMFVVQKQSAGTSGPAQFYYTVL